MDNHDPFAELTAREWEARTAAAATAAPADSETDRIAKARALVKACIPPAGSPADIYLTGRGLDIARLPQGIVGWNATIRAAVFPLRNAAGETTGFQGVYLNADGSPKRKEGGRTLKLTHGLLKGSALVIPGQGAEVLVTEGPEDALSLWQATGRPVRAACGASNLGEVPLPDGAGVVLVADNDPPDSPAQAALGRAVNRQTERGHRVRLAYPPAGVKDGNDLLREQGDEAVRAMIAAARPMDPPQDEPGGTLPPDPSIITECRRPAPELPREVFGPWGDWIAATAEGSASPADYVACALLVVAAAIIGNARWVRPWAGWESAVCLWLALIGSPSSGKSPALVALIKMVRRIETDLAEAHEDSLRDWKTQEKAAKCAASLWESDVEKAVKEGRPPPVMPARAMVPEKPARPRLMVSDTTPEAVAAILAGQPRGILAYRDELSGWLANFDRYGGGGERGFWLESFNGGPFVVDRVKHDAPLIIAHNSVCALGGIQPDRLSGLMLGGDDDGLVARFLMTWPEPVPPRRPKRVADDHRAEEALRRLLGLGMGAGVKGQAEPVVLGLAPDAADLFDDWRQEHVSASADATGMLAGHYGKMPGLVLRLALVLDHLWWSLSPQPMPPAVVSVKAIQGAIILVSDYFMPMAERTYGDAALPEADRLGATLARWIVKTRPALVNASDLRRKVRLPGLTDAAKVKMALEALVETGWLIAPSLPTGRGRPKSDYAITPRLWEALS